MKLCSHFYAMVDPAGGHALVALARILLDAGARVMQLRLKTASGRDLLAAARAIAAMCRERGATLIVDDRADIAMLAGAAGVHLGQEDLPLEAARRLVGRDMIIGISTHSIELAVAAERGGADYVGFGPLYPGGLRNNAAGKGLAMLREVRAAVSIPIVAIGGITEATMPEALAAGADACAIITEIVRAPTSRLRSTRYWPCIVRLNRAPDEANSSERLGEVLAMGKLQDKVALYRFELGYRTRNRDRVRARRRQSHRQLSRPGRGAKRRRGPGRNRTDGHAGARRARRRLGRARRADAG